MVYKTAAFQSFNFTGQTPRSSFTTGYAKISSTTTATDSQIRSSAWLEHYTDNVGVTSSNLVGSTTYIQEISSGGLAQLARASALHAEGHRFDSDILHRGRTKEIRVSKRVTSKRIDNSYDGRLLTKLGIDKKQRRPIDSRSNHQQCWYTRKSVCW